MDRDARRLRVEPTDEWEQVEILCAWPEQRDYELIRPLVLFGGPAENSSPRARPSDYNETDTPYYSPIESARRWIEGAGFSMVGEEAGDGYHHFLAVAT